MVVSPLDSSVPLPLPGPRIRGTEKKLAQLGRTSAVHMCSLVYVTIQNPHDEYKRQQQYVSSVCVT